MATYQPSERFREQQVYGASRVQRMLMVYDAAIMGCGRRDLIRTTRALNLLRSTLDFDQGPVAAGLYSLYMYCNDLARAGKYDEAARILRELVSAWVEVLVKQTQADNAKGAMLERGLSISG